MNAPPVTYSAAVAPVHPARFTMLTTAPFGADPRDKFITCFANNCGTGRGEVARLYRPPSAPRGADPRDRHITGGYMERGVLLDDAPHRAEPAAERVLIARLGPYPLRLGGEQIARLGPYPLNLKHHAPR